jgi:flavin reductase (DIM6/NTAB) family NADH-FMN oxidoreductase RutF
MLFDFATLDAQNRYKLLCSTIVPRPIAWVVTCDLEGRLNAAPYSFFNVFANEPPVVCIGIGARSPDDMKDTGSNIRATSQFVVNLVSADTAEQMNVTAIDFPHDVNEIAEAGLTTLPSTKIRPPRIAESPVAMECELFETMQLNAERLLVFGRVVAMHIADDTVLNVERCYVDTPKLGLIGRMHGAGGYIHTNETFEMPRIKPADWVRKAAAE